MQTELPVISPSNRSSCCHAWWLLLAGLLGATGVALGAFEAHGLEKMLTGWGLEPEEIAKRLHNCEVAVRYQMFHAVALLGLAAVARTHGGRSLQVAGVCWLLGVLLFCGLLYVVAFTGSRAVVHFIPLGGLAMIVGWLAISVAAARSMGCCGAKKVG